MKYTIQAVRSKDIPYSGGTFKKFECKLKETGDVIYELRFGKNANEKIKVGDVLNGYIKDSSYTGRNGVVNFKEFRAIDAQYVYDLLLKVYPDIEGHPTMKVGGLDIDYPIKTEDPGF